jgi:SOS-response transcriptional repressor LexA
LTPREQDCLDLIVTAADALGCSPSVEELRVGLALASTSGVTRLLDSLERQGAITRERHRARSIIVLADQPAYTEAALHALPSHVQRRMIAVLAGSLYHKTGGQEVEDVLNRIAARLNGRPIRAGQGVAA